jgi:hypothetical protein
MAGQHSDHAGPGCEAEIGTVVKSESLVNDFLFAQWLSV